MFEPILDIDDVKWWFISNYWDVNLSGIGWYKGEKVLINQVDEGFNDFRYAPEDKTYTNLNKDKPMVWGIYRVSEEIMKPYWDSKTRFENYVGTHWTCLDEDGNPGVKQGQRPQELHSKHYEEQKSDTHEPIWKLCLSDKAELIGYIEERYGESDDEDDESSPWHNNSKIGNRSFMKERSYDVIG